MIALPSPDYRPIVSATKAIETDHMADDPPSELMLTYAELGDRLGIGADGARFKARRAGWPITQGNDGRARVRVRVNELPDQSRRSGERRAIGPDLIADLRRAYADRSAELIARAETAEQEAEQWRSKAEQNNLAAERERGTAERERAAAEMLRDQLVKAERRVDDLTAELRELRRPWLVRVVAADIEDYRRFQSEHLSRIKGVQNVRTEVPSQILKPASALPV